LKDKSIKAVIFDLDGTLYTLGGMKFWMALSLWSSVGMLRRLSAARMAVRNREFSDCDKLMSAFYMELAKETGSTRERVENWYQNRFMPAFVKLLEKRGQVRKGLEGLLHRLKQKEIKLAVVSDFGAVKERLEALDIDVSLFDELMSSEEAGALKPSPKAPVMLSKKWSVAPSDILMVGDRIDRDMECARRAGMQFIGISDSRLQVVSDFFLWTDASSRIEAVTTAE
jgi:HAD superfamily hydrolase (TIGR01549 family)